MPKDSKSRNWASRANRRRFLKATGVSLASLSLAGCSGDGGNGNGNGNGGGNGGNTSTQTGTVGNNEWPDLSGKSVHVITEEGSDAGRQVFNTVADDFREATGAEVEVEFVGGGTGGNERVAQLMQAGSPPEIYGAPAYNIQQFLDEGILEPVTDVVEDTLKPRLGQLNSISQSINIDGEWWAVPHAINLFTYFWRRDLGEEVGISESDFREADWETDLELAREVDDQIDGVRGTYVPAGADSHNLYRTWSWMETRDGKFATREGDKVTVAFDEGENRDKLVDVLNHLKARWQYSPDASDSTFDTWANSIVNNQASSTMYAGFRPIIRAHRNDREFASEIQTTRPPGNPDRTSKGIANGLITFQGANTEAAKSFLSFFMQEEHYMNYLMDVAPVHNVPIWEDFRQGDTYQSALDEYRDKYGRTVDDFQETAANDLEAFSTETDPAHAYVGQFFNPPMWNMASDLLINDRDPNAVIDEYAPQVQELLDEAQQ